MPSSYVRRTTNSPRSWKSAGPATSAWGALYQEVASESRECVRQSLVGRHEVTQEFMRPVRAIREKLVGLSFLDPGIARPPLTATR
jgi:Protein of unknown function (DUF3150)